MGRNRVGAFGAVAAISRADIESALAARGYQKGAFRELVTPQYSRVQAITMGVDEALTSMGFPTKPATRMTLDPTKWGTLVAGAQVMATRVSERVKKSRELVGMAGRGV